MLENAERAFPSKAAIARLQQSRCPAGGRQLTRSSPMAGLAQTTIAAARTTVIVCAHSGPSGPIFDRAHATDCAPLSGRVGGRRDLVELRWRVAHPIRERTPRLSSHKLGSRRRFTAQASDTRGGVGDICDRHIPTGCHRRVRERVQPVLSDQARTRGCAAGGAASAAEHPWLSVGGLQNGRCHDSRGSVRAIR